MAAAKANRVLGMLKHSFTSRDFVLWKRLYTTYVRPHLEFSIEVWNPYMKGDIKTLEQVQRRATRIPHVLKKYNYAARCRILGLTSLKERRVRGDMIQFFKFERNLDLINWHHGPLRGNRRARLFRELVKNCEARFNWFGNRIAGHWNALPSHVINPSGVNDFRNRLDHLGNLTELNTLGLAR